MPRFFIPNSAVGVRDDGTKTVMICGEDAMHITKSLRMKPGEKLDVCDMGRREYSCVITEIGEEVFADVLNEKNSDTEPPYTAVLYRSKSCRMRRYKDSSFYKRQMCCAPRQKRRRKKIREMAENSA